MGLDNQKLGWYLTALFFTSLASAMIALVGISYSLHLDLFSDIVLDAFLAFCILAFIVVFFFVMPHLCASIPREIKRKVRELDRQGKAVQKEKQELWKGAERIGVPTHDGMGDEEGR